MSAAQVSLALFAATLLLLGVVMLPAGFQESAAKKAAEGPSRQITLAELVKNGPGDGRHVEISRFELGKQYAIKKRRRGTRAELWVPLFGQGDKDKPLAIAKLSGDSEEDIKATMPESSLRALVSDKPEPLKGTIGKTLRTAYPNMKAEDTFLVLDQAAAQYRGAGGAIWFTLAGVFFGAALLLILVICLLRLCRRRRNEIPVPHRPAPEAPAFRDSTGQLLQGVPDPMMQEFLARSTTAVNESGIEAAGTSNFSLTLGDQGLELILDPYWRVYEQSADDEILEKILADAKSAIQGGKLALDSPYWDELEQSSRDAVPDLIRVFAAESARQGDSARPTDCFDYPSFSSLFDCLLAGGDVHTAAYAACPYLVDTAEKGGLTERTGILLMAGTIYGDRYRDPIPGILRAAFDAAVDRVRKGSLATVREEARREQTPLPYLLHAFGMLRYPGSVYARAMGFDEEEMEIEVNECPHCGEHILVQMENRGPVTMITDERGHMLEKSAKRMKPDRANYPDRLAVGNRYLQQSDDPTWPEHETGSILAALAAECGDRDLATRILDMDAEVQCPKCSEAFKLVAALAY